MPERRKILAAVEDLFFTVKINEAAKRAGLVVEFVKTESDLLAKAKEKPTLVVMDLNINAFAPVAAIEAIRAGAETKSVNVLGYVSHIQGELKQQAQSAGANMVLARSAFSQNMAQIFKRHAA